MVVLLFYLLWASGAGGEKSVSYPAIEVLTVVAVCFAELYERL